MIQVEIPYLCISFWESIQEKNKKVGVSVKNIGSEVS